MKTFIFLLIMTVGSLFLDGCSMFKAWKSIPPPGGCDQCHTVAVSTDWKLTYKPVNIADERGRMAFQTPEYNQPASTKPDSPLEKRKVEEQACFECHKTPNDSHKGHKGRFHH